jgi:murein DD-endopeptidase MepM/ murein hydrolase activator NlpD
MRAASPGLRRFAPVEAVLCALCLWAAFWHTPAGALVRAAGGWFFKIHATARPLLSYYGAGSLPTAPPPAPAPLAAPVPPSQALAYGAWSVLHEGTPLQLQSRLHALSAELGSDRAAVLALFAGEEKARYAVRRAGADADLADLARELPPSDAPQVARAAQALMNGGAYALAWPMPESVHITSPFGWREHPLLGGKRLHAGIDLGTAVGTPVHAAGAGVVRRAGRDSANGRAIVIDHGGGVVTIYCHNDELLVHEGQRVERGQLIARSGNTGRSTGPHLHYQLDLAGAPVDPLHYRSQRPKTVAGATD